MAVAAAMAVSGPSPKSTKTRVTKELEEGNMSANLMHTMQIQIAQYINSIYGGDIMGELQMKKEFIAPLPIYPKSKTAWWKKPAFKAMHNAKQSNALEKLHKRRKN